MNGASAPGAGGSPHARTCGAPGSASPPLSRRERGGSGLAEGAHARGFVSAALDRAPRGGAGGGRVGDGRDPAASQSGQPRGLRILLSFIFNFGRRCEIFDWPAGCIARSPIAVCAATSHPVPGHKGGCKRWVRFSLHFCLGVRRWSHHERSHPFGGANRGRGLPAPTYLTFCHFRIDFSSFTFPRFFCLASIFRC